MTAVPLASYGTAGAEVGHPLWLQQDSMGLSTALPPGELSMHRQGGAKPSRLVWAERFHLAPISSLTLIKEKNNNNNKKKPFHNYVNS